MEIEIALRKHELPYEFSGEALGETRKLPDAVRKTDWKGREDITALPLVTIDGETARDFDDAVYCERKGKGFRLVVAIADVSHYVTAGGALDEDAYARGNSVYFPRRVIPDAAGEAFQRPVFAESAGRPPVHGVRHGDCRHGQRSSATASIRR
jgi:ribonuclease R